MRHPWPEVECPAQQAQHLCGTAGPLGGICRKQRPPIGLTFVSRPVVVIGKINNLLDGSVRLLRQ
jgi:hypothetical protein